MGTSIVEAVSSAFGLIPDIFSTISAHIFNFSFRKITMITFKTINFTKINVSFHILS